MPNRSSTSLEGQPEVAAEPGQPGDQRGRGVAYQCTERAGARQKCRGLVRRHPQALVEGDIVALLELHVCGLPRDQPKYVQAEPTGCGGRTGEYLVGEADQGVAGQDGRTDAEGGPRGRAVVALGVAVHHVVV